MKQQWAAGNDNFGNGVYRITVLCDATRVPVFTAKYNFQLDGLVDCPEFLVYLPLLDKVALKFGLKMVKKQRFDEFYEESISGGRGLIKMQALKSFPGYSRDDRERQENREEYSHAQQYVDRKGGWFLGWFTKVDFFSKMVIRQPIQDKSFIESNVATKRFSPLKRQIIAATGPIIASAAAGMTNGFSAILLPQLQKPESTIQITNEQSSWIASMAPLPMAAGCLLGGFLMEKFGRKVTHLILSISFAVGFCVLSVALTYDMILVGRFITGFSCGLVGPPASVYIAETSHPRYRGILLAGVTFAVSFGIFLSHLFGTFFHWKMAALYCSFFMVVSYAFVVFCPESPSWLMSKGQGREAEAAFRWLRGHDAEAIKEFEDMVANYSGSCTAGGSQDPMPTLKENLLRKEFILPLITLLVFFFTMQFSGVNIVAFYSISLMKTTIGSNINEYLAMLIVDLVRVITSLIACALLKIFGRRPLAMLSGCGTTVSLIGLSIFLYFQTSIPVYQNLSWMALIFLISYIIFIGIGLFPLPWCMSGEVFPIATRGIGTGLTSSFNFVCFFVVIKTGPSLFSTVGTNGTFMIYGIISLIGTLLLYMILPETKNRTLQEIEDSFKSGWRPTEKTAINQNKV